MTNKTILLSTAAAALMAISVTAYASTSNEDANVEGAAVGSYLGKTEAEVRSALEAKGFTVAEIEVEDDEIEAEVQLNGQNFEIEVSAATGNITETEADEADDDKD